MWSDGQLEQRAAPRFPLMFRMHLAWEGGSLEGYSTDISATGVFVETARALPPGHPVRLRFTIPADLERRPIEVLGVVVRAVGPEARARGALPGVGIRFTRFEQGEAELRGRLERHAARTTAPRPVVPASKRGDPRVRSGVPVRWGLSPWPDRDGWVLDISSSGLYLGSERVEPADTMLHLALELPSPEGTRLVRLQGRVVRSIGDGAAGAESVGMGLSFEGTPGVHLEPVVDFVRRRLEHFRSVDSKPQTGLSGMLSELELRRQRASAAGAEPDSGGAGA